MPRTTKQLTERQRRIRQWEHIATMNRSMGEDFLKGDPSPAWIPAGEGSVRRAEHAERQASLLREKEA
jgi:hypothetical protein